MLFVVKPNVGMLQFYKVFIDFVKIYIGLLEVEKSQYQELKVFNLRYRASDDQYCGSSPRSQMLSAYSFLLNFHL